MKNPILSLLLLLIATHFGYTQEKYHINLIPSILTSESNVVKRMEELSFEIKDLDEAVLHHKYALTILNEKGDEHAALSMFYDKLHSIRSINGALYDANGNLIRKLKSKEVMDLSGVDDNNLIDDNRKKYFSFYHKTYPYTIEFETVEEFKNTLFFPSWVPQEDEFYAVEQSRLTIITPAGYDFRYKAFNYKGEPKTELYKDKKSTIWEISNLKPISYEYGLPNWLDITTSVLLAPTTFRIQNYSGNMSNWKEFGKFVYALKQGKDELPSHIKLKVQQLLNGKSNDLEKIQVLYQFMQQHTRYVSIQLGIGGWQPFDASFVANKGYGDCKALTNYMYSLLKEAGITSHYALIKAGRNTKDVLTDFTSQQFNHVILCVPLAKDTVWLECTSQTMPTGYLGDFTADRHALLINESGGQLVKTPKYGLKENLQIRKIEATILDNGSMTATVKTHYKGMQQDHVHDVINTFSNDKIKEHLNKELDFSTYDVAKFKYIENKKLLPSVDEELELMVHNYAAVTGKRLFVTPNIMSRSTQKLSKEKERMYPIKINYEFEDIDTITIKIPNGFELESIPQPLAIDTKFGKFNASIKVEGNNIIYSRDYKHYSGTFSSDEYLKLAAFYEAIYKHDRSKIVFVKKPD